MKTFAWMVATGIGVVSIPLSVWAQERPWNWGWHPMWEMMGIWGIGMMLVMLAFWVLVIVAVVAAIRWLIGQGREPRRDQALEILRERYAKGEMSKEEFDAKKRDLGGPA